MSYLKIQLKEQYSDCTKLTIVLVVFLSVVTYLVLFQQNEPRTSVAFLKTHKCGSTTIQNILFRYAYKHNLTAVLPETGVYIGYDTGNNREYHGFSEKAVKDTTWYKGGLKPQILAVHSVWKNLSEVQSFMKIR